MEKHLIILVVLITLFPAISRSQQIPNGGFESWYVTDYFEEPEPYSTTNSLSYMMGDTTTVSKSTDAYAGNYSARLETMAFGTDTVTGLMMVGELRGENIIGGVPFTTRPASLSGYVKYDLVGGDELTIVCLFTRQGLPIGMIQQYFSGTQENFTQITMPVNWLIPLLNPDSLKVVIANTSSYVSGNVGSIVYLDNFQFSNNAPFPNGEFENWTMLTGQEPDSWTTLNYLTSTSGSPYATKTNDKHGGNWAIRMENITSFVGQNIGYLTNGYFQGFNWIGGLAVEQNPSLVSGYYKYLPEGTDTAQAGIFTTYYDISGDTSYLIEEAIIKLPPASEYTYFEIPLEYNSNPPVDTVNISFAAGLLETGLTEGSVLFLDDLVIDYYPVSVKEYGLAESNMLIYPNPASGKIHVRLNMDDGRFNNDLGLMIYDVFGRAVEANITSRPPGGGWAVEGGWNGWTIDVSTIPPGVYFVSVYENKSRIAGGKFVLAR